MIDRLAEIEREWHNVDTIHCYVGGEPEHDDGCRLATGLVASVQWLVSEVKRLRELLDGKRTPEQLIARRDRLCRVSGAPQHPPGSTLHNNLTTTSQQPHGSSERS